MSETDFDPSRRLCPDGSCIGVMKSDGHCSVCGRDASGAQTAEAVATAGDVPEQQPGADAFDPNRRLCDDGSCVGVIGSDGRCGVCRQPGA
jgi:hypothetical protein